MSEPVIKCENVYKIFGANAKKMLQDSNGNVDAKIFQENGCIVAGDNSIEKAKSKLAILTPEIPFNVLAGKKIFLLLSTVPKVITLVNSSMFGYFIFPIESESGF